MRDDKCIVLGCTNAVVRVYAHASCSDVRFGTCAFHGEVIMKYGTGAQLRDYLFPADKAASGGNVGGK